MPHTQPDDRVRWHRARARRGSFGRMTLRHRAPQLWLIGLLAAAAIYSSACARRPAAGEPARPGYAQKGDASWYGPKFHGRTTANGETYNMLDFTAAHRSLPFNTLVRVTTLHNERQIVVRINDRGPFIKGRIIDLSYTSAKILGIPQQGVMPVRVEVTDQKKAAAMLERQRAALKRLGVRTWSDEEMAALTRR